MSYSLNLDYETDQRDHPARSLTPPRWSLTGQTPDWVGSMGTFHEKRHDKKYFDFGRISRILWMILTWNWPSRMRGHSSSGLTTQATGGQQALSSAALRPLSWSQRSTQRSIMDLIDIYVMQELQLILFGTQLTLRARANTGQPFTHMLSVCSNAASNALEMLCSLHKSWNASQVKECANDGSYTDDIMDL